MSFKIATILTLIPIHSNDFLTQGKIYTLKMKKKMHYLNKIGVALKDHLHRKK